VRIFVGTEPVQHRAERVFFHALRKVRNPARVYEVYRMLRLPGFAQGRWRTGFTNFRFAIPDLAGRHGRALYNDVDEIYLGDPAELGAMCAFICSVHAGYLNGQNILMDGGLYPGAF
jgi:NAD(P)-dependent dehydrogenase (short-subunit alcohol dehydrogenase family)